MKTTPSPKEKRILKKGLEKLYLRFDRSMLSPDPLECVPAKGTFENRELSAFIASVFAYGRADLIVRNVNYILSELGHYPHGMLMSGRYKGKLKKFRYRFHKRADLIWLLDRLRDIYKAHGSMEKAFTSHKGSVRERGASFANLFAGGRKLSPARQFLVPSPQKGSACKRMNLFLRWMARRTNVDLGLWKARSLKTSELIMPLDVHVHRIAHRLGLVSNGSATFAKAEELTENLKLFDAKDPVRFDFAICSLGKLGHCVKKVAPKVCAECAFKTICTKE